MPNLKEIAGKAKVSVSVVSRALNPSPDKNARIAEETRSTILDIAASMGYKRNRAAEFLKRGRNATIGVFLSPFPNRLYADFMFGVSEEADQQDFPLTFHLGMNERNIRSFIKKASNSANSGIITFPFKDVSRKSGDEITQFQKHGGKTIIVNSSRNIQNMPVINIDDLHGGKLATEHFIKKGCNSFIAEKSSWSNRYRGFQERLLVNGFKCQILPHERIIPEIRKNMKENSNLPIGFFAYSDESALQIMTNLKKAGVCIGKEVLVIGYDDLYLSAKWDPPLTTIHQPFREQGRIAVKKLINMIYGKKEKSELIKPKLIIRESA